MSLICMSFICFYLFFLNVFLFVCFCMLLICLYSSISLSDSESITINNLHCIHFDRFLWTRSIQYVKQFLWYKCWHINLTRSSLQIYFLHSLQVGILKTNILRNECFKNEFRILLKWFWRQNIRQHKSLSIRFINMMFLYMPKNIDGSSDKIKFKQIW